MFSLFRIYAEIGYSSGRIEVISCRSFGVRATRDNRLVEINWEGVERGALQFTRLDDVVSVRAFRRVNWRRLFVG